VLLAVIVAATASGAGSGPGPVLRERPVVTGDATEGSRLTVSPGKWAASGPLKLAYQWYRCDTMGRHCRPLHDVDQKTHQPGPFDVGRTLSVAVTATDSSGSTHTFASLIGPIAGTNPHIDSLTQPIVEGSAVQGKVLQVNPGDWRPKPKSLVYQWARCNAELRGCAAISGETSDKHSVGPGDLGHALVAIVQARDGATARAVFSTATELAVAKRGTGPSLAAAPTVAVVLQRGSVLTGSVGTWKGSGKIQFSYSWYRCDASGAHCKTIRNAIKITHVEGARDIGHTLGFAVHATDDNGTSTAYAPLLGPVASAKALLVSTGPPALSGSAVTGQAIQVSGGSWSQPPSSLGYQWQSCNANGRLCTPIAGATAASDTVAAADAGHKLLAIVHATAGNAAQDVFSGATPVIAAPAPVGPTATAPPTVTGTLEQGAQLTGNPGTWSGAGTVTYGYNWYRCDASGAHCLSVHGATKPTYTLGPKDVGQTIGFAVHAADSNGSTPGYAALVGPVAGAGAALAATEQPTVTGTAAQGQPLQASNGNWTQPATAFAYQWQRCNTNGRLCAPIDGATAATYAVTAADSGHTLAVVVTATYGSATQATISAHTGVAT
jgi:predicted actin-binding protein